LLLDTDLTNGLDNSNAASQVFNATEMPAVISVFTEKIRIIRLKTTAIAIVPSTEPIASCNACGEANYERVERGAVRYAPIPTRQLWELRLCPNGTQTFVTKLCRECLDALHGATGVILDGRNNVSYRK